MNTHNANTPRIEDRPWYTLEEAAALLGLTLKSAYNKIHLEEFAVPHFKLGRRVVVMKEVVDAYFEQRKREGLRELKVRDVSNVLRQ